MGPPRRLQGQRIKEALAAKRRTWLSDNDGLRGSGRLVARVSSDHSVLLYFRYSVQHRLRYIPLGPYSAKKCSGYLTLAEARDAVARYSAIYRVAGTRDVRLALSQIQAAPPQPTIADADEKGINDPTVSLAALATFYAQELAREGKASAKAVARTAKHFIESSELGAKPARTLTPEDIANLLRPIFTSSERSAAEVRALLNAAYERARHSGHDYRTSSGWKRFGVTVNPVRDTVRAPKSGKRDRNLDEREVGWLWLRLTTGLQCASIPYRFLRVNLLLGGQRCQQLIRCTIGDFNDYKRTLLILDGKGRRDKPRKHLLPLSDEAYREITELIDIAKGLNSNFIFAGRLRTSPLHFAGVSHAVHEISNELIEAGLIDKSAPFCYIDLRRTTESRMGELDIPQETRAQLLSHGLSGIQVEHYDRADYTRQKRDALATWQRFMFGCAETQRTAYNAAFEIRARDSTVTLC
jgi:integrase